MKLEALRRSVVRLFRKSDTFVPPKIDRSPGGYSAPTPADLDAIGASMLDQLKAAGLMPPDAEVRVHRGRPPSSEPAPSRPGVKPPADPEIDNASWEWWETCRGTQRVPGWGYCRFANRVGDKAQFAFGYVRGSFGIWAKPFRTCTGFHPDVISSQQVLVTGTHLLTGHAIGMFESLAVAVEACELADRVAAEWATAKQVPDLNDAIHRTQRAWNGAGIVPLETTHAHEEDGDLIMILGRTVEAVMEGKPERLS